MSQAAFWMVRFLIFLFLSMMTWSRPKQVSAGVTLPMLS